MASASSLKSSQQMVTLIFFYSTSADDSNTDPGSSSSRIDVPVGITSICHCCSFMLLDSSIDTGFHLSLRLEVEEDDRPYFLGDKKSFGRKNSFRFRSEGNIWKLEEKASSILEVGWSGEDIVLFNNPTINNISTTTTNNNNKPNPAEAGMRAVIMVDRSYPYLQDKPRSKETASRGPPASFWRTATARTSANGEVELTATIDGQVKTITEASLRRHLKLEGNGGITTLPNTEIFEQLALMGVHSLGCDEGSLSLHELTVLCNNFSNKVTSLETELAQTKQTYGTALTKLIKKVKKLEQTVKSTQARRTRIVVSDDEEGLEDPSKQERMIEEIDEDTSTMLVTPTMVSSQSKQSEDHLKVLSAAKVLADAARKRREGANITPYTRRKGMISTASGNISTAEEPINIAGVSTADMDQDTSTSSSAATKNKGKAIMQESEPPKKIKKRVQAQLKHKELLRVQKELDSARQEQENDPVVLRYHARQNRSFSVAEVRKNMCIYLKNRGGYKLSHFKGMTYEEIRPIFEKVWDQNHTFVPKDSEIDKEVIKRSGFDLQQESSKKAGGSRKKTPAKKRAGEKESDQNEGMNVEALQTKYPLIDWEIYTEDSRVYWKIIRVGYHTKIYQFFEDMLKNFDKEDLVNFWKLVKDRFSSTEPTDDLLEL
ncbi:hypothetical protein Tco_1500916 [Tanacetum coccineum]